MVQKSNSLEKFLQELKRRKTIRVITVYAATAFIILQLVDIISKPLQLPEWTLTLVIVLLGIGFIIATLLSWVYDITPAGVKKTKPAGTVKHTYQTTSPSSSGWKIATYASGVIIVGLVAFNFISRRSLNTDISKLDKSIAVLPFLNDSPSDSTTYFIDGLMEEILDNLQIIGAFSKVLSRTSTEQYRGIAKPPMPKIAKDLDVNFIVEGSGQKYGNFYRIRVQLIEGKTDKNLWVNSYEKEIKGTNDIYGTQSEIAQSIASALKATITPEEKKLIEKTSTTNLTALDFFRRGREEHINYWKEHEEPFSFWKDNKNSAELQKAQDLYNKALKYDPTFAQAYTGLAWVYWNKQGNEEYFSKNYMDSVLILCDKALSFDNKLPEAHMLKGYFYLTRGIINRAGDEFDELIKINPNSWEGYKGKGDMYIEDDFVKSICNYQKAASLNHGFQLPSLLRIISWEYLYIGFMDKAKYYNLEALKLDGDSASYFQTLANSEYFQGNYKGAIEYLDKGYAIDSTKERILEDLGSGYMFLNKYKESLKYYKKFVAILNTYRTISNTDCHRIGWAYWENGYKKEAGHYFNKQLDYSKNDIERKRTWGQKRYPYYDIASIYAFRGDKEKAYKNLRIFNERHSMPIWTVDFMKRDPLLNSIRNEPEFQQIAKDVEAKYQAEHERVRKWLEETGQL